MACGLFPERVRNDDPRLAPMYEAIRHIDRRSMGFTEIAPDAVLRVEWNARRGYDAMLHVDGRTSRTIAFRRAGDAYEWIGEQEIFSGPKTFKSVDGEFHETITITYETRPISGAQLGTLDIRYRGEDQELSTTDTLSLERVRPILARWEHGG